MPQVMNEYDDGSIAASLAKLGERMAGDVAPIRPPVGYPANNAARQNQIKNQQRQRPNLDDPANSNIKYIYG